MLERGAMILFSAAALWPSALCALTTAMTSPYQRALTAAWCGAEPQSFEVLGHCSACWSGAVAFALAGLALLYVRANELAQRRMAGAVKSDPVSALRRTYPQARLRPDISRAGGARQLGFWSNAQAPPERRH